MNLKPLLKYFPEIHHLPVEQQYARLEQAYALAIAPKKIEFWLANVAALMLLIVICGAVISVIGPLFALQQQTTALILVLVVLPLFVFFQQRRFIARLRSALAIIVSTNAKEGN